VLDVQKNIIEKVEKELGKERAAMVKQEIAGLIAEYKAGLPGAEKALIDYRNKLMSEVGKINDEGFATSFKSANMAGAFNSLLSILQDIRIETDAANDAFDKYITGFNKKPEPTKGKTIEITADEQRLQLKKQLAEEEKKLAELEKKPGTDPLKAIEEQKQVIKDLKERLDLNEEILSIDDQIKQKEEELDRAIANGNQKEIEAIAKKILELQKELDLREKLARSALDKAEFEGFVPTTLTTSHLKTPTLSPKPQQAKSEKTAQERANEMAALVKKSEKEGKKIDENQQKRLEEQLELRKQIVDSVANLVYELGKSAGLDENSMAMLSSGLETFAQLASGGGVNIVSVANMAISGIQNIISQFPNAVEIYESHIERINYLLDRQQFLIDQAERSGGGADAREGEIELLREQLAIQEKALKKAQDYLDPNKFKLFRSNAGMKRAAEQVKELTIAIAETSETIATAEQELSDFLAGGVTQNTLADALAQGFQEGKASVDDFADYMNDILLNAVTDIFKQQTLLPLINEQLYPIVTAALEDGILTDDEANLINQTTDNLVSSVMEKWKASTEGLNLGEGSAKSNGLVGAIRRELTEETGGQVAGLLRAQKDDIRMSRDYLKTGTEHLASIERNTYDTVEELKLAVVELKAINTNTRPTYSGLGGA
jgi:hypothetical protein